MKKLTLRVFVAFSLFFLALACQKELSYENGGLSGTAQGTLGDSLGNCANITVKGKYAVDTTLADSNYLIVKVNFTTQGKFHLNSDTVNGMWFQDSGYALTTGTAYIKVPGRGKPLLGISATFTLGLNGNYCSFTIISTGTGGASSGGNGTVAGTDYFPVTTGSLWKYQYIPKLSTIDTFSVRVVPNLVTVDSLSYSQFATTLGDTFYFSKKNGNYYALSTIDFDYTFLFDSVPSSFITYPFLKESANVNDSWETPQYGIVKLITGSTTEYGMSKAIFTIKSKNTVPYTIAGKTYTNVINVQRQIIFLPTGSQTSRILLTGNSYYAKGYGLIDQVLGSGNQTQYVSITQTPTILN